MINMAPATAQMSAGQCAFLSRMEYQSKGDLAQVTPNIPQQVYGHPCVILKTSPGGPTGRVLIMPLSSYGCSARGDNIPPWKNPSISWRYRDQTVFRAGSKCNSARPDPKRPFIDLEGKETFKHQTWFNVAEVYTVPATCLNAWTCNEKRQLTAESLNDLLQHAATAVKPKRWRDVHNALGVTVPATRAYLPTPPPSPTRQLSQPWRSQTHPVRAEANGNKRKRRTSSDGDQAFKVPKLASSPQSPSKCALSSDKDSNHSWTTVKSKKGKK